MVARQLKIVSQIDTFTISATRNIQYVLKMLVCLIVFVKDIFNIYLNNIYHIVFSLHLVCLCLGERLLYALPSSKKRHNSTNFEIHVNCIALETKLCIYIKELYTSKGWFVYAKLLKHY